MTTKAIEMLDQVTAFLCRCGELPAFKAVDDEFQQAEDQLTRELTRLLTRVENRLISELVKRGYIPTTVAAQRVFVEEFLKAIYTDFSNLLVTAAEQEQRRGRVIAFNELRANGIKLKFTEFDPWTAERLRTKVYEFSRSTFDGITGNVAESLGQSYVQGLGIQDAARALREHIQGLKSHRLRLIARTEINSAQNEGVQVTLVEYGIQYKQWLTARDSRVRGHHIPLHGEVVKVNEPFSNGLVIPGDRSGPIAEWINCRCRIRPYIPPAGMIITHTPFRP